jgi:hypothetical protein
MIYTVDQSQANQNQLVSVSLWIAANQNQLVSVGLFVYCLPVDLRLLRAIAVTLLQASPNLLGMFSVLFTTIYGPLLSSTYQTHE